MQGSSFSSDQNVLGKFTNNISCGEVLTNIKLGFPVLSREDAIALLNGTAELLRTLPDNLSEMGRLWAVGIVIASLVRPRLNRLGNAIS